MISLQEQYNLIQEGKGHKDVFIRCAKSLFPFVIPNSAGINETVQTLKKRGIISDKPKEKELSEENTETIDPMDYDDVFGQEFLVGYYYELKQPENDDKTTEELKQMVAKNLRKNRLYYVENGQFGCKNVGYKNI